MNDSHTWPHTAAGERHKYDAIALDSVWDNVLAVSKVGSVNRPCTWEPSVNRHEWVFRTNNYHAREYLGDWENGLRSGVGDLLSDSLEDIY